MTNGTNIKTTDYLDGFQYNQQLLEFFPHPEGYENATNLSLGGNPNYVFNYVYNYTDHLGNIRVSYTKDPQIGNLKILDESHYYPFGLKHQEYSTFGFVNNPIQGVVIAPLINNPYKYKYNGKEWQDELSLNMYDMDMRQYDPAIARWVVMDPVIHHSMSPYSAFDNNPVFWADPSGAAPELGSVFEQSGMKVTSFAVQGTGVGIGAAGNDPPAKRTTQIVQSFKYDKTQQGTKTPSGTDYIRESEVTVSQNVNGDGKYVTRTITSITTVSIDSKGKINENNITKTVIVHSEISNNKGDIKYENTTATGTVEFNNLSPAMQTATTNAATEKSNLGHSPLQDKADNINLGINLTVGAAATVATGGTSTVVQVVAGVAGSIVADKALPEVNAEQVSKELYYKQEVLK